MDVIDHRLLALLVRDGRASYQQLAREVNLSANTVAERVRRLERDGVIRGYHAELNLEPLGRELQMVSDVRLGDHVDPQDFEQRLHEIPEVIGAMRLTGDYDFQLRMACGDRHEFEHLIDRLKEELGVRELLSRLLLHEVSFDPTRMLGG
jgi:Lrp/AsnC family leucine-responsive transcriptional regulator